MGLQLDVAADECEAAADVGGQTFGLLECDGGHQRRIERSAQFVAERGQERVFCEIGFVGKILGESQFLLAFLFGKIGDDHAENILSQ